MDERDMMHGRQWTGQNPKGWHASEKFRGVRGYWDGIDLWTRGGIKVALDADTKACFPSGFALDGEVFCGHGEANGEHEKAAERAVKTGEFHGRTKFIVFDAPQVQAEWPARLATAEKVIAQWQERRDWQMLAVVEAKTLGGLGDLDAMFKSIIKHGGEGLMMRRPDSGIYQAGRTKNLLKVKHCPKMSRGIID